VWGGLGVEKRTKEFWREKSLGLTSVPLRSAVEIDMKVPETDKVHVADDEHIFSISSEVDRRERRSQLNLLFH
jgi:hypothetical protein